MVFDVHVDDPEMLRAHDFRVWTPWESPHLAEFVAARRAVLRDGACEAFVRRSDGTFGKPALLDRLRQARSRTLVEAVARYAVATPRRLPQQPAPAEQSDVVSRSVTPSGDGTTVTLRVTGT